MQLKIDNNQRLVSQNDPYTGKIEHLHFFLAEFFKKYPKSRSSQGINEK